MNEDYTELTNLVRHLVVHFFSAEEQQEALFLLSELDPYALNASERIHIAAIKGSDGSLQSLASCMVIANTDYRDLLVWTDFGHDINAHLRWANEELSKSGK